jgi:methionyl-tRNA formyltransferase
VANRLCGELPVEAVVVDERVRRPTIRRAFRGGIRRGIGRVAHHAYLRVVNDARAREAALRHVLGTDTTAGFQHRDGVIRVDGINSREAFETIGRLEPDALLIYGTVIVNDRILGLANDLAFNMHTGISPRYRGTDCAFWPIVNAEPEWIGATVHECTSDVDGGQIFGVTRVEWSADDGIHELFARAVAAGAELYVDAVRRYLEDGGLAGERQDLADGREYRGYMRTLGPELRARWRLRRGMLRQPPPRLGML